MKTSKNILLSRLPLALMIAFLTMVLTTPAWAEPTLQPLAGRTCVQLDEDFAAALQSLEISLGILKPAFQRKGDVCFPIRGGGIDLENDLKGETFHTGGLALMQDETGTTVELTSFIIDTAADTPVLTGLVIVDGNFVARLPLFDLDLSNIDVKQWRRILKIRNVDLTLTKAAADALNEVFFGGEEVLQGNEEVGVARVFAVLFGAHKHGCPKTPRECVRDFVSRFYKLCLDRHPDSDGLENWVNNLLNQAQTGTDVAKGFIYSQEFMSKNTTDDEFLTILYKSFFDRNPDPAGREVWLDELNKGKDRRHVLDGFLGSQEFIELCEASGIAPN